MISRTPHRLERNSAVTVPGVRRDPALIFRYKVVVVSVLPVILKSCQFITFYLESVPDTFLRGKPIFLYTSWS